MAYSTIVRKKCKCGCHRWPATGYNGYSSVCAPAEIKEKVGNKRKVAQRNKNARLSAAFKIRKDTVDEDKNLLTLWYLARRYEMTGVCIETGKKSSKDNDKYFRWSIAHVVPKALVKSVALNSQNWLELCIEAHTEFDRDFETASKMKCFAEAKRKFNLFKHLIPPDEMRRVNPYLSADSDTTQITNSENAEKDN